MVQHDHQYLAVIDVLLRSSLPTIRMNGVAENTNAVSVAGRTFLTRFRVKLDRVEKRIVIKLLDQIVQETSRTETHPKQGFERGTKVGQSFGPQPMVTALHRSVGIIGRQIRILLFAGTSFGSHRQAAHDRPAHRGVCNFGRFCLLSPSASDPCLRPSYTCPACTLGCSSFPTSYSLPPSEQDGHTLRNLNSVRLPQRLLTHHLRSIDSMGLSCLKRYSGELHRIGNRRKDKKSFRKYEHFFFEHFSPQCGYSKSRRQLSLAPYRNRACGSKPNSAIRRNSLSTFGALPPIKRTHVVSGPVRQRLAAIQSSVSPCPARESPARVCRRIPMRFGSHHPKGDLSPMKGFF